jgi:methylmalonyl-CoA/ethylmalonyl-CoA epimerase
VFTRLDHVGIACHDLDATVELYTTAFGFELVHEEVNEEQGVREAMLRVNGCDDGAVTHLQLLAPTRPDSPVAAFLRRRGEGVHHVAFGTGDVVGATQAARDRGARVVVDRRPGTSGSTVSFLHPRDCGGVLVELVEAGARTASPVAVAAQPRSAARAPRARAASAATSRARASNASPRK